MHFLDNPVQLILGFIMLLSAIGVIIVKKPVHASLAFLLTLLSLAALYLQLSAQFVAVMQILVYAGAILVIFMFVIVLFQDAHQKIEEHKARSSPLLLGVGSLLFFTIIVLLGFQLGGMPSTAEGLPKDYGTVQALGNALYIDFFFPFEAVILLFLVSIIGALYIGKKV